ncbi:hypothetical protein [Pedobacter jeongneungensis]|uniref:hypothetical protein n=1 Tax=Pedobacter jeongneungensis TaxID=947309 RepID=UPI00046A42EA|nr:hypothetical protein [Pedobacter jeongneungensis]
MAKRRTRKTKQRGFKEILILLGMLFSCILFIIKIIFGRIGWLEVFAPVIVVFLILFLLSVLKTAVRKV